MSFTLKQKPKQNASKQAIVRAGKGGIAPPVEYQFKPGVSGNPGGRPKILAETTARMLKEEVEVPIFEGKGKNRKLVKTVKMTRAEQVCDTLIGNACTYFPHSVSAFGRIREMVEPTESEEARSFADTAMARFVASIFHERLKPANAIEV